MKITLSIFSFLLASHISFASVSADWIRIPDLSSNIGTAIARDADDNVYTTASTGSIILIKRDRFGNFQWQTTRSTTVPFNYEYPTRIHIDPQNNAIVVGHRHTVSS